MVFVISIWFCVYLLFKNSYLDSCKTLNFSYDDIQCRFYDIFLNENKKPLEKIDGFDEVTYLKYKLCSQELREIPTEMEGICLNQRVTGKTKLNLFILYKIGILNVLMFLVTLILFIIFR